MLDAVLPVCATFLTIGCAAEALIRLLGTARTWLDIAETVIPRLFIAATAYVFGWTAISASQPDVGKVLQGIGIGMAAGIAFAFIETVCDIIETRVRRRSTHT